MSIKDILDKTILITVLVIAILGIWKGVDIALVIIQHIQISWIP